MYSFKAAIFDLDGTLLDSLGMWEEIDKCFFEKRGHALPEDYYMSIAGLPLKECASFTKRTYSIPESEDEIIAEWTDMSKHAYAHDIRIKPGSEAYLRRLKTAGIKLGVATTLSEERYTAVLKNNGIYELFDAFATTDTSGLRKTEGKVYLECAGKLGVKPSDCIVYEDIWEGIEGAHAVGMRAVLVYDRHNQQQHSKAKALCDDYIENWENL